MSQDPFGLRHADAKMQGTLPGLSRDDSLRWIKSVEDEFNRGPFAQKMAEETKPHVVVGQRAEKARV